MVLAAVVSGKASGFNFGKERTQLLISPLLLILPLGFGQDSLFLQAQLDGGQFYTAGFLGIGGDLQLNERAADILHMTSRSAGAGPDGSIFIELDFASVAHAVGQGELNEILGLGVEAVEGVVAGAADPDHAIRGNIEGVGDLVEVVGQWVGGPLLGGGIKLAKDAGAKTGHPDHAVRRDV